MVNGYYNIFMKKKYICFIFNHKRKNYRYLYYVREESNSLEINIREASE